VALAKSLKTGSNLLLLDEPTNDLDVATLSALEELLASWPGSALIVSHDRYFLDRVATSILAFEGDGKVVRYPGNYTTYLGLRAQAAAASVEPPPAPVSAPREQAAPPVAKALSYAERRELEGILDVIAAAERRVAELEHELSQPSLYASRAHEAKQLGLDLEAARAEVSTLIARWETLESRRGSGRG
jgi:ABC transport system ATP-binding/permease protein